MFYVAQPISQKLMVHHLLDLPFGCSDNIIVILLIIIIITWLSLRAGGRGFSPATMSVVPGYFYWKIEEK